MFTIFRPSKNQEEKSKRHKFIHYVFKSKIFVPLIYFLEKKLSKYMIKKREDIPDRPYNKNLFVLWDSFEEAYVQWVNEFQSRGPNRNPDGVNYKTHCYQIPSFCIRLYLTIILEDIAYKEQFNFILFKLQGIMNKVWNPEIQHKFPLYVWQYDRFLLYFLEWHAIAKGGPVNLNVVKRAEPMIEFPNETRNLSVRRDVYEKIKSLEPVEREKFMVGLEKFILKLDPKEIKILNQYNT